MTVYVALLRGINVGGHRLIKMADLKQLFQGLGFEQVETYIQSGNVVFTATEAEGAVRRRIEQQIEAVFGFTVPTAVRSAADFERIVALCPFAADALAEGDSLNVALLVEPPLQDGIEQVLATPGGPDECAIVGHEVYVLCRQGVRNTVYTNNFLEKKLGVPATMRNWQTITKLAAMAKAVNM